MGHNAKNELNPCKSTRLGELIHDLGFEGKGLIACHYLLVGLS